MIQETRTPATRAPGRWISPATRGLVLMAMLGVCRVAGGGVARADEDGTRARQLEAKVKVAYIYNFPKFIEWPGDETCPVTEPIRICILGTDTVGVMLDELSDRKVKERPIQVAHLENVDIPASCHLLYISRSEERQVPLVLQRIQGSPVLAVSDVPRFAHEGGMIGFAIEGDRIKVELNQRFVREAGLKVRAKLLEIARIVQ
jgi:hypothetical protein